MSAEVVHYTVQRAPHLMAFLVICLGFVGVIYGVTQNSDRLREECQGDWGGKLAEYFSRLDGHRFKLAWFIAWGSLIALGAIAS
jgi:hypothetical protein